MSRNRGQLSNFRNRKGSNWGFLIRASVGDGTKREVVENLHTKLIQVVSYRLEVGSSGNLRLKLRKAATLTSRRGSHRRPEAVKFLVKVHLIEARRVSRLVATGNRGRKKGLKVAPGMYSGERVCLRCTVQSA